MWRYCGTAALLLGLSSLASAAELTIRLSNAAGVPLADAVVFAAGTAPEPAGTARRESIVQRIRVFEPFVTVVQTGTGIFFPNEDPMLHHVYSFSPAKRFEIRLYKGTPAAPVVFDKSGIVVLGCNVHDWMLAYVVVVDTPLFAKSGEDGVLHLALPEGTHALMAWYPGMREPTQLLSVTLTGAESRSIDHQLNVKIRSRPKALPLDPLHYSLLKRRAGVSASDVCTSPES